MRWGTVENLRGTQAWSGGLRRQSSSSICGAGCPAPRFQLALAELSRQASYESSRLELDRLRPPLNGSRTIDDEGGYRFCQLLRNSLQVSKCPVEEIPMDVATGRDRRRYPRFAQNDLVRLTLLGEDGRSADSRIVDVSAGGVRLRSPMSLQVGSLVKIEWKDTLILGEVLYSQPMQGEDDTVLGIELTRALYGMPELRRLNASLYGTDRERAPQPDLVQVEAKVKT